MQNKLRRITWAVIFAALALAPVWAAGKLKKGDKAPAFTLTDLKGDDVSLSDFAGKVVFINFWQSTLASCRVALPHTQELSHSRLVSEGKLVVLAINCQEGKDVVSTFMKKQGYDFRVPMDTDLQAYTAYGVDGVPTFFVIDRAGKVHLASAGFNRSTTPGEIDRAIRECLGR